MNKKVNTKGESDLVWNTNDNYLILKLRIVREGGVLFSHKCALFEFAFPNLSLINLAYHKTLSLKLTF